MPDDATLPPDYDLGAIINEVNTPDAPAARRDVQVRHALRVALNVIDELDGYFLKPHPLDVTEYWRTSRLKYLAMRVEDAKNLAAALPVEP